MGMRRRGRGSLTAVVLVGGLALLILAALVDVVTRPPGGPGATELDAGAPSAREPSDAPDLLVAPLPSEGPGTQGRQSAEPTRGLDLATRTIRGRVVPWNGPLPESDLHVVAGGLKLSPGETQDSQRLSELGRAHKRLPEASRAEVAGDGTFELSIAKSYDVIQLHVIGDHAMGDGIAFDVGGQGDMGAEPFEVEFSTAAHVTFQLIPPSGTTQTERDQFVGARIWMLDALARTSWWIPAEVSASGLAGPITIPGSRYEFREPDHGDDKRATLAPFMVTPSFEFVVRDGESPTIEVPLTRGRRFEGTVTDSSGMAIPGALVRVEDDIRTNTYVGGEYYSTDTDEQGHFMIPAVPIRSERLHVEADGFLDLDVPIEETRNLLGAGHPTTLVLDSGRQIELRVSAPGGRPAANFPIGAAALGAERIQIIRGQTDEQGRLTLSRLPNVDIVLVGAATEAESQRLAKPGTVRFTHLEGGDLWPTEQGDLWFARTVLRSSASEEPGVLELILAPAPRLGIRIVSETKDAAQAHRVTLQPVGPLTQNWPESQKLRGRRFAASGAEDALRLQAIPGRYALQVSHGQEDKDAPLQARPQVIRSDVFFVDVEDQDLDVRVTMDSGLEISGTLVAPEGEPLEAIPIELSILQGYWIKVCEVRPNAEGRFTFSHLRPGQYWVKANEPFVLSERPVNVTLEAGRSVRDLSLEVSRGGYVRIHVTGADGEPTSLGQPKYLGQGGRLHWAPVQRGLGSPPLVGPFAPGPLTLQHHGSIIHRTQTLISSGATQDIVIQLPASHVATLDGTLRSPTGDVEGVELALYDGSIRVAVTYAGLGGRFQLPSPITGRVELRVGPEYQKQPYTTRELRIVPGTNSAGVIELPGGKIDGTLVRQNSFIRPPDFTVAVRRVDQPRGPIWKDVSGDAEGFLVPFLEDGTYEIAGWDEHGKRVPCIDPLVVEIKDGKPADGLVLKIADR